VTSVKLENIIKNFDAIRALDNVQWEIKDGEFMVLVGPSGCGKTTLLRIILGSLQPDNGRILMDEKDLSTVPIERRNIGFVPQDFGLFPHFSVNKNIAYGLKFRNWPNNEIDVRVKYLLKILKLDGFADRKPNQLSWGQQQRVALARALAIKPQLLLLDEPLSAIDWVTRQKIAEEIKNLQKDMKITTIYVTHDINESLNLGQRITVMNNGKLEQCDTPQNLINNPKTPFVTYFIGQGKL